MNRDQDRLGVALTKKACPLCGATMDGDIIMNTRLTVAMAEKVKELHGKVVEISNTPCDTCKEYMEKGILIIQVDEAKTDDQSNPWRTGKQVVMTEEAFQRIFTEIPAKRACFLVIEAWDLIGLP